MNAHQENVARACLAGCHDDRMTFPQIVGTLIEAGFDGYAVDLRRGVHVYYAKDGASVELTSDMGALPVAPGFDAPALRAAIRAAQMLAPGYSYRGFCATATAAGVAGYLVSFEGRRALYYGRTAETHVEHFPA